MSARTHIHAGDTRPDFDGKSAQLAVERLHVCACGLPLLASAVLVCACAMTQRSVRELVFGTAIFNAFACVRR